MTAPRPQLTEPARLALDRPLPPWSSRRVVYTPATLGINYNRMHQHGGSDPNHWLTTPYDVAKVEQDLAMLAALGIRLLRLWAPVETVLEFTGGAFGGPNAFARNLDDALRRCVAYGMSVVLVMADGHQAAPARPPYDGHFLWDWVRSPGGRSRYGEACRTYVDRFGRVAPVHSWEIANEPYGNLTWAAYPQAIGVTKDEIHAYLYACYAAIKPIAAEPVGFSDIEEEEQAKYRTFSDRGNRARYVDDCTDYYSMHVYRARADQMADFRSLTGKPKFLSEVGGYNYEDPTGAAHANQPAFFELLRELPNLWAVIDLSTKALNAGFEFVMPWDVATNPGMFVHHPDGSHEVMALPRWMANVLATGSRDVLPNGRRPAVDAHGPTPSGW